ncbi:MAG: hypothetical protein J5699_08320 [Bacteroidales bacterium]|nr:hypothetical protein [Bacteroidales bacterium]
MKQFYHYCADGQDSRNFIISKKDFIAAMNIIALCVANTGVTVVAFSLEDSHPHFLLFGTLEECAAFKEMFETTYRHYAVRSRLGKDDYNLCGELYPIGEDLSYLMNVAVYTIIQPTKDGKSVIPYDYLWGTGFLYFRDRRHLPVWCFDDAGNVCPVIAFGSLNKQQQREMVHSRHLTVPSEWQVCNNIILPSNYVAVSQFESIYKTHNCFRVFLSNNRKKEEEILLRIASERGVSLEDVEVRQLCGKECKLLFGVRDPRRIAPKDRIVLAQTLRRKYRIAFRQLSFAVRLPETELRKYVK